MDFTPGPRVADVVETARAFVRDELLPLEPALRREGVVALLPRLAEKRRLARQTGLFAAQIGRAHV